MNYIYVDSHILYILYQSWGHLHMVDRWVGENQVKIYSSLYLLVSAIKAIAQSATQPNTVFSSSKSEDHPRLTTSTGINHRRKISLTRCKRSDQSLAPAPPPRSCPTYCPRCCGWLPPGFRLAISQSGIQNCLLCAPAAVVADVPPCQHHHHHDNTSDLFSTAFEVPS